MPIPLRRSRRRQVSPGSALPGQTSARFATPGPDRKRRMGQKLGSISNLRQRLPGPPPTPPPLPPGKAARRRTSLLPLLRPKGDARLPAHLRSRRNESVLRTNQTLRNGRRSPRSVMGVHNHRPRRRKKSTIPDATSNSRRKNHKLHAPHHPANAARRPRPGEARTKIKMRKAWERDKKGQAAKGEVQQEGFWKGTAVETAEKLCVPASLWKSGPSGPRKVLRVLGLQPLWSGRAARAQQETGALPCV